MYSSDNMVGVFNISFYNPSKTVIGPTVMLSKTAIILGAYAARYCRSISEYVKIGYDKNFDVIVVAPCPKDDPLKIKLPPEKERKGGNTTYIPASDAFKAWNLDIKALIGERRYFSFPAYWIPKPEILVVDIYPKKDIESKIWIPKEEVPPPPARPKQSA